LTVSPSRAIGAAGQAPPVVRPVATSAPDSAHRRGGGDAHIAAANAAPVIVARRSSRRAIFSAASSPSMIPLRVML
jgi:hypothetical protein